MPVFLVPWLIGLGAGGVGLASGWFTRGAVDDIGGAKSTFSTLQLILMIALLYAGYRFMKGLK